MDEYKKLESTVRDVYGKVVWSHKIQEKQADIYSKKYRGMEKLRILSSAITSAGILAVIFHDELWLKIGSSIISLIAIFISSFFKSFDLHSMVAQHQTAANSLLPLRDEFQLLILRINLKIDSVAAIYEDFEEVMHRLHVVYSEVPRTSDEAVKAARIALNVTKDNTLTDDEIDSFLPIELRKNKNN